MEPTDEWLASANARYRAASILPAQRPFRAIADYSNEFSRAIEIGSPLAKRIFQWFKANSKPGSHAVGAMFTSVFFYDTCFWPVSIPLGYGSFRLNALDALNTMPANLKQDLLADREQIWIYTTFWADCVDYGYGITDPPIHKLRSSALAFAKNADRELRGTVAQLLDHRPNPKAILSARMATEIFLKTFLIQEKALDEAALKKLGHKIDKLTEECLTISSAKEFAFIRRSAGVFPDVSTRYDGADFPLSVVWEAFFLAQLAGSAVVRHYSGRDTASQITRQKS